MRSSLVLTLLLGIGGVAHAFADPTQFFANPSNPHGATLSANGEGVYFTGAPRWSGLDCSSCHAGGPQAVRVQITADPPGLFSDGYTPGQIYQVEVVLQGETLGLENGGQSCTQPPQKGDTYAYVPCNNNSFAAEVDAATGPLSGPGRLCAAQPVAGACPTSSPLTDETFAAPDGDAVFGNRVHDAMNPKIIARNDPTSWRFWFTAPAPGTGPLTLYVAAVDGSGGDGTAEDDQDVAGDDTVRATVPVREAGAPGALDAVAGCAVAGRRAPPSGTLLLGLLCLAAAAAARGRGRRRC